MRMSDSMDKREFDGGNPQQDAPRRVQKKRIWTRRRLLWLGIVAAVLLLDNYDELMKNLTENQRSALVSEIDSRLDEWVAESGGMLRRYQRERYLFIFDEQ